MRNLSPLCSRTSNLPASHSEHFITATTLDLDEDVLYAASERINTGEVDIHVWRVVDGGHDMECVVHLSSPCVQGTPAPQIVCFTLIPDTRALCVITRSGDIASFPLDSPLSDPDMEVVGTVYPGILAARTSPDDTLLALLTSVPSPSLILMSTATSDFDVVTEIEGALHTSQYGADRPINVGWGSKTTQFHGSLGKGAAHNPDTERGTTTPDDDGAPRISWRGDAQFFVVSSVQDGYRILRVYNRLGELQSTAENVPGLEHALAWRPSGGLIAATQRFGDVPTEGEGQSWALGKGRNGRHDVVFFERNGLRHGEFMLREKARAGAREEMVRCWGYRVREVGWNADSSILSVWIERDEGDIVQLWTTGNYHWYLKLEIPAPGQRTGPVRFYSIAWHPEDAARLFLSTQGAVLDTHYALYTAASHVSLPHDSGLVGVIDGDHILLTPFRTQNVPPPMSSSRLALHPASVLAPPPLHISFSPTPASDHPHADVLAALFPTGEVGVWALGVHAKEKDRRKDVLWMRVLWRGVVSAGRQVCVRSRGGEKGGYIVGVLGGDAGAGVDVLRVVQLDMEEGDGLTEMCVVQRVWDVLMPGRGGRMIDEIVSGVDVDREGEGAREVCNSRFVWQSGDGCICEVINGEKETKHASLPVGRFPQFCKAAVRVSGAGPPSASDSNVGLFIGHTASTLFATSSTSPHLDPDADHASQLAALSSRTLTLSHSCTSYTIAGSHLIWTATSPAHEAVLVKLDVLRGALGIGALDSEKSHPLTSTGKLRIDISTKNPLLDTDTLDRRRIERGARIITAVPSTMSLVLQMPRGNLETVAPRPLVLDRVSRDVRSGDYRAAFLACRKHRVDLNVLVEQDPARFATSLSEFVQQLDEVEYINLFLSGLGRSSQPARIVTALCDGIREELEHRDVRKFVKSILTAHVVKTPPDYEAGLALLLRLRKTDPELVEEAVKYIIFLVDADRLFDTALGMYDFSLVLLVAQYSQKDPREYLPFLRSLRALEGPYQHFKIDEHLKRHEKALRSLHHAGTERFEEAKGYVEQHRLHREALVIWKEEPEGYDAMLELYGDYLFERREFKQAALAFVQASRTRKAMVAHEKALDWRELFDLVVREGIAGNELVNTARRVAEDLGSKQRHSEAARVLLDYVDDVDEAVASLVRGSEWSEARRISALRKRKDLVQSLILPGTLEARSSIYEEISEIKELLHRQVTRLGELATRKLIEPDAFYGIEDPNLANVDVMTDVSHPGTMFTRYTVAPTTSSHRSRRTSRSKRKLDRKAGRKGTVDEEEYLLKSLCKLVSRLDAIKIEASTLIPHLLVLSDDHAVEGRDLQGEIVALDQSLRVSIESIWTEREQLSQELVSGDISGLNLAEKVPKPSISDIPWEASWLLKA